MTASMNPYQPSELSFVSAEALEVCLLGFAKSQCYYGCCRFQHAAAERTGLADRSTDLVSICLVMHELPQQASRAIAQEAFRILRPGGTFAIMVSSSCVQPSQCSSICMLHT